MKPLRHFTNPYLLNPVHPVTITVAGAGGTGSHVIHGLAKINYALLKLGHPGLNVIIFDGDAVSQANIGRQLFSEAEIGQNKAGILASRINRIFGTRWLSRPYHLTKENYNPHEEASNILITCVDSIAARVTCAEAYSSGMKGTKEHPYLQELYWMDFGNSKSTAQFVIGTVREAEQPKGDDYQTVGKLPHLFDKFPGFRDQEEEDNEPSCSTMEALGRQDLMINATIATLGTDILFRMFREGGLSHQGLFLNLPELITSKIPLNYAEPKRK